MDRDPAMRPGPPVHRDLHPAPVAGTSCDQSHVLGVAQTKADSLHRSDAVRGEDRVEPDNPGRPVGRQAEHRAAGVGQPELVAVVERAQFVDRIWMKREEERTAPIGRAGARRKRPRQEQDQADRRVAPDGGDEG